ncbi:MAG: MerR family transcriptional regulator [Candidatus Symbiothrix sp.]|jgi:DNA-binding transcriptional MerR regulator|nr:MerR family transcriptional regulator [Candidatus Symbiothrix sp.]
MRFQVQKLFYSIKEVAEMFNIEEPTLRYWETEFPNIKPGRTDGNIRQYRQSDIEEIRTVYYLVKDQGMTLAGAKQKLNDNRDHYVKKGEVVDRLKRLRTELLTLKNELSAL